MFWCKDIFIDPGNSKECSLEVTDSAYVSRELENFFNEK